MYHEPIDEANYLGSFQKNNLDFDLYFAPQGNSPTVIAKFGPDGDYFSGLLIIKSLLDKNKAFESQLKKLAQEEDPIISALSNATQLAISQDYLDDQLNLKIKNKIKP